MALSLSLRIGLVVVGAGLAMSGVAVRAPDTTSLSVESQPDGSATVVEVAGSTRHVVFHGSPAEADAYLVGRRTDAGRPAWPVAMIALGMVAVGLGIVGRLPSRSTHGEDEGFDPGDLRDELAAHYGR
jgi:hypothetical protein